MENGPDYEAIARALGESGRCIYPGFLPPTLVNAVREDLNGLRADGRFKRAGTGQGEGLEVRDLVRRDEIHWLDPLAASPAQQPLWERVEGLRMSLNRSLFLGLTEFEGHYAAYPPGGFYRRHLDTFRTDNSRAVSWILYLNRDWKPVDGGQLRIHEPDGSHSDIDPVGGTLVCFLSREVEHEVLPSRSERCSFTGWFKQSSGGPALR